MILVDKIVEYGGEMLRKQNLHSRFWCHMVSDESADELHAFAAKLGLRRSWSQERPKSSAHHYDLVPSKRALAVMLGAVEISSRELVMQNYDGFFRRREGASSAQRSANERLDAINED